MAGQPRDRSSRTSRKNRAARTAAAAVAAAASAVIPPPSSFADLDPVAANPIANGSCEEVAPGASRCCTAEQLEELLLKKLDDVYSEALSRLMSLGYDEAAALRAVLRAGHCHGKLDDPVSNIVENSLRFLSNPPSSDPDASAAAEAASGGFSDLRRLEEYSLAGLVCLLQNKRPSLSRTDAMWCLLIAELHVDRANAVDIPPSPYPAGTGDDHHHGLCHFHAAATAAAAAAAAAAHHPDPAIFDPAAFMRLAMRQSPAGFLSCLKSTWTRMDASAPPRSVDGEFKQPSKKLPTEELIDSVVRELEGLNFEEKAASAAADVKPDPKSEMVYDLVRQIRELEVQVKERKEWAQQKAVQAARKLSADLTELRVLRLEREVNQRRKKEKQVLEDETMKRLSELENELKKMSGQVDRANAVVRRLEMENAEIRAEMEAAKLSASESVKVCQGLARKEKKCSKKLEACERQKQKMQDEILDCKMKVSQAERELAEIMKANKEAEVKLREDIKAKEQNMALVDEERRAREAAKANADRRVEALRQKIELDSQRYKDDIERLQQELLRLQSSAGPNKMNTPSTNDFDVSNINPAKTPKETNRRMPPVSNRPQGTPQRTYHRRVCVMCKTAEAACMILLPCAHQALCVGCNKEHEKNNEVYCPCCGSRIHERIRVYGASSN